MSGSWQFNDEQMKRRASGFAQTCNLLSQYIKEKGSLRNLNLEIDGKVKSLEALVKTGLSDSVPASTTINALKDKGKSIERMPSLALDNSSINSMSKYAAADSKAAPLTIFYNGAVLVFDDYPANEAKELLTLAKKGSSQMSYGISSNNLRATSTAAVSPASPAPPRPEASGPLIGAGISSNSCQEKIVAADLQSAASNSKSVQIEANSSELRIARRSSIHKFLEKRRDRAGARGPYHGQVQEHDRLPASSSKEERHLELKL